MTAKTRAIPSLHPMTLSAGWRIGPIYCRAVSRKLSDSAMENEIEN